MIKISDHITYAEAIHSNTAKRRGIDNTPNEKQIESMKLISEKIFEPLRSWCGGPIKVNSFFRSVSLNEELGIMTNAEMYHYIKDNLKYDQIIWEFGTDAQPNWIHISYVSEEENRNRCLKAYKENGKTKYKTI